MANLMAASNEWARRPNDQRFQTLKDLLAYTFASHTNTRRAHVPIRGLSIVGQNGEEGKPGSLVLRSPNGIHGFSTWSFGQLSREIGAPANFMRSLTEETVARVMNEKLGQTEAAQVQMFYEHDGAKRSLAFTTPSYGPIPNYEIANAVMNFPGNWRTLPGRPSKPGSPTAHIATEEELRGMPTLVKPGELIDYYGLYASPEDMVIFMADWDKRVDDGTDAGLSRGFIVGNSEVGKARFWFMKFLFQHVCGNHIIWGASDIQTVSIKHVGTNARARAFSALQRALDDYANSSTDQEIAAIAAAKKFQLGQTQEDLIDNLYDNKSLALTKRAIGLAYDSAVQYETEHRASPLSAWGFVQGLTRISQAEWNADERVRLDKAGGRIMAMATQTEAPSESTVLGD